MVFPVLGHENRCDELNIRETGRAPWVSLKDAACGPDMFAFGPCSSSIWFGGLARLVFGLAGRRGVVPGAVRSLYVSVHGLLGVC